MEINETTNVPSRRMARRIGSDVGEGVVPPNQKGDVQGDIHPRLVREEIIFKVYLKRLREELGLTQKEFGALLGLRGKGSWRQVMRWERLNYLELPHFSRMRDLRAGFEWVKRRSERPEEAPPEGLVRKDGRGILVTSVRSS